MRWDVAVWASGLMSAHMYKAPMWLALSIDSSPMAMAAQASTMWSGRFRTRCKVGSAVGRVEQIEKVQQHYHDTQCFAMYMMNFLS